MFFSYAFYFCPDPLWRWSNLTSIFFRWVGEKKHQLVTFFLGLSDLRPIFNLEITSSKVSFWKSHKVHQTPSMLITQGLTIVFDGEILMRYFLGKVIFPSQKWLIQRRWAMIFAIYAICLGRCCVTIWSTSPRSRKGHDLMFGLDILYYSNTVDGSEIRHQLRLVVFPTM